MFNDLEELEIISITFKGLLCRYSGKQNMTILNQEKKREKDMTLFYGWDVSNNLKRGSIAWRCFGFDPPLQFNKDPL